MDELELLVFERGQSFGVAGDLGFCEVGASLDLTGDTAADAVAFGGFEAGGNPVAGDRGFDGVGR